MASTTNLTKMVMSMVNEAIDHGQEPPFVLIAHDQNVLMNLWPDREEIGGIIESSLGAVNVRLIKDSRLMAGSVSDSPEMVTLITQQAYAEALAKLNG